MSPGEKPEEDEVEETEEDDEGAMEGGSDDEDDDEEEEEEEEEEETGEEPQPPAPQPVPFRPREPRGAARAITVAPAGGAQAPAAPSTAPPAGKPDKAPKAPKKPPALKKDGIDRENTELEEGRKHEAFEALAACGGEVAKATDRLEKMGIPCSVPLMSHYKAVWQGNKSPSAPKPAAQGAMHAPSVEEAAQQGMVPTDPAWNAKLAERAARSSRSKPERYLQDARAAKARGDEAAADRYLDLWEKAIQAEEAELERSMTPPAAPLAAPAPVIQPLSDGDIRYRNLMDKMIEEKFKGGGTTDPMQAAEKMLDRVISISGKIGGGSESDDVAVAKVIGHQFEHGLDRLSDTVEKVWGRKKLQEKAPREGQESIIVECHNCKSKIKAPIDNPPTGCPRCGARFGAIQDTDGTILATGQRRPRAVSAPIEVPVPAGPVDIGTTAPVCFAGAPKWGLGIDPKDPECMKCVVAPQCALAVEAIKAGVMKPPMNTDAAKLAMPTPVPEEPDDEEEEVDEGLPQEAFDLYDNVHRIAEWLTNDDHDAVLAKFRTVYGFAVNRKRKTLDARYKESFGYGLYIAEVDYDKLLAWVDEMGKHPEIAEFARENYESETPDLLVKSLADADHRKTLEAARADFKQMATEDGFGLGPEAKGAIEVRINGWVQAAQKPTATPVKPPALETLAKRAAQPGARAPGPSTISVPPQGKDQRPTDCPICKDEGKAPDNFYPKGAIVAIDDLKAHMSQVHVHDQRHPEDPLAKKSGAPAAPPA